MDKILCTIGNEFSPRARALLKEAGTVVCVEPTRADLLSSIGSCTALVTQLGVHIDREAIDRAPRLRAIATATTGTNHIDTAYARKKGIEILSLRGERAFLDTITSTAELALGLLLALERQLLPASGDVLKGRWGGRNFKGHSLAGKTLGIVGLGRLGSMLARAAAALGMNVLYCDPTVRVASYRRTTLTTLLQRSDAVSLHVPLTPLTEGLISASILGRMKEGTILINTSRGEIVDEAAVLKALQARKLGGYGADVLAGEHLFEGRCGNHPLVRYARTHPNVLLTPHVGGMTAESREETDVFIAKKLRAFLRRHPAKK